MDSSRGVVELSGVQRKAVRLQGNQDVSAIDSAVDTRRDVGQERSHHSLSNAQGISLSLAQTRYSSAKNAVPALKLGSADALPVGGPNEVILPKKGGRGEC